MAAARTRAARSGLLLLITVVLILGAEGMGAAADAAAGPAVQVGQVGHKQEPKKKSSGTHAEKKAKKKPYVYRAHDRTSFNYPLSRELKDRFRIRHQIRMAIQHAPAGSSIRLATFTFDDPLIEHDLIAAHRRGVSVQVLVARQHAADSASLHRLTAGLRKKRHSHGHHARPSFTRICTKSCRGKHGLLHTKLFMFSTTGNPGHRAHWVSMVGSANLTRFAAVGQWNHLDTLLGRRTYANFLKLFNQMKTDTYRHHSKSFKTKKVRAWAYPKPHYALSTDPFVRAMRKVDCTWRTKGSKKVHRSTIRIGMYAWFNDRGNAFAKIVRNKWERGCNVQVIYAETNGTVLRTLRSRAGRGPIPVSRSVTLDRSGEIADYNHSKYVTLNGRYNKHPALLVWTGSMNFTALSAVSDELVVRLHGPRIYGAYRSNFLRVWHAPSTTRAR